MRTILHIGMYKTGTTALQAVWAENAATLLDKGILYPLVSPDTTAHHVLFWLRPDGEPDDALGRPDEQRVHRARTALDRIEQEVADKRPEVLLLSTERWFRDFGPGPAELVSRLRAFSDTVEVVAWVREPVSRFIATYLQVSRRTTRQSGVKAPNYRQPLEVWEGLVGRENVKVRIYDRAHLVGGDIITDFDAAVFAGQLDLPPSSKAVQNVSLSAEAALIFQTYAAALTKSDDWTPKKQFEQVLDDLRHADAEVLAGRSPRLKPETEAVLRAPWDDVLWLRETYGITFKTVDYAAPPPPPLRPATPAGICDVFDIDNARMAALVERLIVTQPQIWWMLSEQKDLKRTFTASYHAIFRHFWRRPRVGPRGID